VRLAAIAVAIVLATFAVYWPGLHGGFIFDDLQNLLYNPAVQVGHGGQSTWLRAAFSSPASEMQRPLAMLSFAANHYFSGFDTRAMKLTNIAIHALNALLALWLLRRVVASAMPGEDPSRPAAFAAAAWALHPINLMAVLYVVQRMESLSHTFVLLGLLSYTIGRERMHARGVGWPWIAFALMACPLLGVLAKESAALLPLYALVLELVLFRFKDFGGRGDRRLQLVFLFLLVLPALVGGSWLLSRSLSGSAYGSRDFGPWERLFTEGRVLVDYLKWSVVPDLGTLSLFHDDIPVSRGWFDPPTSLPAWLLILSLLPLAWWLRKRRPLTSLGIGWFLCAHVLTASFIPLDLMYEHRNYFASLGICLVLADWLMLAPDTATRRRLGMGVAGCFLAFLALTTFLRATEWSDPLRFAETEAVKHPNSPRATYEAARMLILAGKYDANSPYTRRAMPALERAMRVPGSGALPAQAALLLAARTGQPLQPHWWELLRKHLREHPGAPENQLSLIALSHCAISGYCQFPVDDMLATFEAGLERGEDAGILSIFGNYALNALGDQPLALRLWREAARRDPRNAQFQANLADLEIDSGNFREAEAAIATLRVRGQFGQYAQQADALQSKLEHRRKSPAPAPPPSP
jgi:hypothetical protein